MEREEMVIAGKWIESARIGGNLELPLPGGRRAKLRPRSIVGRGRSSALVLVSGQAETQCVGHRVERCTLQILECLHRTESVESGDAGIQGPAARDAAVSSHRHALALQERLAEAIGAAWTFQAWKDEHRV